MNSSFTPGQSLKHPPELALKRFLAKPASYAVRLLCWLSPSLGCACCLTTTTIGYTHGVPVLVVCSLHTLPRSCRHAAVWDVLEFPTISAAFSSVDVRLARVEDYRAQVATLSLNFFYFLLPLTNQHTVSHLHTSIPDLLTSANAS